MQPYLDIEAGVRVLLPLEGRVVVGLDPALPLGTRLTHRHDDTPEHTNTVIRENTL